MSTKTATPPVVAHIVTGEHGRGASTPRPPLAARMGRRASTLLIALMIVFIGTMGMAGTTQSASAGSIDLWPGDFPGPGDIAGSLVDKMCDGSDDAPAPTLGLSSGIFGNQTPYDEDASWGNKSVTIYEAYGTGGFVMSDDSCLLSNPVDFLMNTMSNMMFAFVVLIVSITVGIFRWATSATLMDPFMEPMKCIIKGCGTGNGLKDTLFLEYLIPIVMLGALWVAWTGLAKKRTTDASQGVLWMIVTVGCSLAFMANPTLVPEKANYAVNSFTTTITNGVTSATSASLAANDVCYVKPGGGANKERGNRMAACSLYKAMLLTPWSVGQFGEPFHQGEMKGGSEVKFGGKTINDLRVTQIEAQTISHEEHVGNQSWDALVEADAKRFDSVRDAMKADYKGQYATWTGSDWGTRFQATLVGLVAAACMSVLVILVSFATVVLAVGMILLLMVAPIFLLIGVHPGFGRGIALKWLELLIGTVLKRMIMGGMLAILVGMYQVILESKNMSWFSQISIILALGIGAIMFRKPIMETLNVVNLGGSRTGMEQGMGNQGKKGMSTAVGAAGGAVGGFKAGGVTGALAGTARGGVMGGRSGSPLRAGMMGHGAGQRVGGKIANKRAKAKSPSVETETTSTGTRTTVNGSGAPAKGAMDTSDRQQRAMQQEAEQARREDEQRRRDAEAERRDDEATRRDDEQRKLTEQQKELLKTEKELLDHYRDPSKKSGGLPTGPAGGPAGGSAGGASGAGPRPQGPDTPGTHNSGGAGPRPQGPDTPGTHNSGGAGPRPQGPDSTGPNNGGGGVPRPQGPSGSGGGTGGAAQPSVNQSSPSAGVPTAPPQRAVPRPQGSGGVPTTPPADTGGGRTSSGPTPPPRPTR